MVLKMSSFAGYLFSTLEAAASGVCLRSMIPGRKFSKLGKLPSVHLLGHCNGSTGHSPKHKYNPLNSTFQNLHTFLELLKHEEQESVKINTWTNWTVRQ